MCILCVHYYSVVSVDPKHLLIQHRERVLIGLEEENYQRINVRRPFLLNIATRVHRLIEPYRVINLTSIDCGTVVKARAKHSCWSPLGKLAGWPSSSN